MADDPDQQSAPDEGAVKPSAPPAPSRDLIAENLRALFRNAELEPLPDELRDLLDRLGREDGR